MVARIFKIIVIAMIALIVLVIWVGMSLFKGVDLGGTGHSTSP
ncbi:sel1 repeat family protein, partial [Aggregatibacter aphrophilus]